MEKISNEFHQGTLATIDLLVIFTGIALKFEKFRPIFSSFSPCSFLPSVATDDRKTVSVPSIALNNKPGHIIFGIQLIRRKFSSFLKLNH